MSTKYRNFTYLDMGSFGVRRSGTSPEGDRNCAERRLPRGRPRTADGARTLAQSNIFC